MSEIPHIRDVPEVVVGRRYRVPCVKITDVAEWLPIIRAAHRDPSLARAGKTLHYHYDWRFVRGWRRFQYGDNGIAYCMGRVAFVESPPVWPFAKIVTEGPIDRVRMCLRECPEFPKIDNFYPKVERLCAGRRIKDLANPVCPHQGISLAGLPVDAEGCVTCPGHGARWSLVTGGMVPR